GSPLAYGVVNRAPQLSHLPADRHLRLLLVMPTFHCRQRGHRCLHTATEHLLSLRSGLHVSGAGVDQLVSFFTDELPTVLHVSALGERRKFHRIEIPTKLQLA